ncbi:MAG: M55 family metallopeptidase [Alicyclobacillus sp.]|nr:M55 family metallopeptidase [Alicyclobacillus sp.]
MKIYISADGEGISGAVSTREMHETGEDFAQFRHWMTQDVNAAIAGAFRAGATEVVVNDAHWSMTNLLLDELDPRAELIRGGGKDLSMVEGVEGCDAAFFVGYHPKVGYSDGVANETMVGYEMYEMRMNGQVVGELEINAAIAGAYGVPVVMVSGDQFLADEAKRSLGEIETAIVKYAIDRWSARCLPFAKAHETIEAAAYAAVKRVSDLTPYRVTGPVEMEIEWTSTSECKRAALVPGSVRKSPRVVAYTGADILEAWRGIYCCLNLGCTRTNPIYG